MPTQPTLHVIIKGNWPPYAHMTASVSASGASTTDNFVAHPLKAWLLLLASFIVAFIKLKFIGPQLCRVRRCHPHTFQCDTCIERNKFACLFPQWTKQNSIFSPSSAPPNTIFIFGYQEVVWLLVFFIFCSFSESGPGCPQVPSGVPGWSLGTCREEL